MRRSQKDMCAVGEEAADEPGPVLHHAPVPLFVLPEPLPGLPLVGGLTDHVPQFCELGFRVPPFLEVEVGT